MRLLATSLEVDDSALTILLLFPGGGKASILIETGLIHIHLCPTYER
jgi:hypothetical protein